MFSLPFFRPIAIVIDLIVDNGDGNRGGIRVAAYQMGKWVNVDSRVGFLGRCKQLGRPLYGEVPNPASTLGRSGIGVQSTLEMFP